MAKKPASKASKGKTGKGRAQKKKVAGSAASRRRSAKQEACPPKPGPDHTPAKTRRRAAAPASRKRATVPAVSRKRAAPKGKVAAPAAALDPVAPPEPLIAPSESPLSAQEVEQFRGMLLEKRAEILGDVSTLRDGALNKERRDAAGDLSSMPIHMADLGSDNYELEFTLGLIEGERAILREIDEALERIRNGTYGVCLATGKPIGKARLKAKPWAKYCYEYALAQEQDPTRRFGR